MATTARDFNGTSDQISCGNPAVLQITGALTVCTWIRFDAIGGIQGFVTKHAGGQIAWGLYTQNIDNVVEFEVSGNGADGPFAGEPVASFTNGQWYHLAGVYVPSTSLTLYVDGVEAAVNTTAIPASILNSTQVVMLGSRSPGTWRFNGQMAGTCLFTVAKDITAINAIMAGGPPASMTGLVGWWDLDGFLSPEPDWSGNGNHGTVTGAIQAVGPTGYTKTWPYPIAAGAEGSAASGGITLGAPAPTGGNVSGDVWIAVVHSADQVAHTLTDWTQIFQANGGGTTSRLSVWEFRYAGSTPNLIVGHTAGGTIIGGIVSFRNGPASGSIVNVQGAGGSGTDASIELATVTPSAQNTMLLACDGAADANNRSTIPTGHYAHLSEAGPTNAYLSTAASPGGSVALHSRFWQTGATGGFVDTQAAADPWASVLLALLGPATFNQQVPLILGASQAVKRAAYY